MRLGNEHRTGRLPHIQRSSSCHPSISCLHSLTHPHTGVATPRKKAQELQTNHLLAPPATWPCPKTDQRVTTKEHVHKITWCLLSSCFSFFLGGSSSFFWGSFRTLKGTLPFGAAPPFSLRLKETERKTTIPSGSLKKKATHPPVSRWVL